MSDVLAVLPVLPLFALAVVLGFRHPLWLLAVYAFVVPFGSAVSLPLGLPPAFSSASTLIGMAAAIGIGAHLFVTPQRAGSMQATLPLWVMFCALAMASTVWSVNRQATTTGLAVLISLVALYGVASLTAPTRSDLDLVERAIVLGGGLTGLYAVILLATGGLPVISVIPRFEVPAGGGENGDPNITAASLLLPLFVAFGRGLRGSSRTERLLSLIAAGLVATAVMLTASRGALVAMVLGMVAIGWGGLGRRAAYLAAVPVLIGLSLFLWGPAELQQHVTKPTSSGRTEVWAIGLEACSQHCVTGSGWDTFPDVHEEILLDTPWASGTRLRFVAHNAWLQAGVELGLLGLILIAAAFATAFAGLRAVPADRRGAPMAALAALALTNTFLSNIDFKYFWMVFIYIAVVTQAHARSTEPPDLPIRGDRRHASRRLLTTTGGSA